MKKSSGSNPVSIKYSKDADASLLELTHVYAGGALCETDSLGHEDPPIERSPTEIVVDASDGFIPLWAMNTVLRWRFQERSMSVFRRPLQAKDYLRQLFADGIKMWGDAPPVKFKEVSAGDVWDFEITVSPTPNCNSNGGCTLASAFFPDGGRHELKVYPTMFEQSPQEQAETMAHEVGHIFGLRHFFANVTETRWRSEIFGDHEPFSIMNYGAESKMTENDRKDLKELYARAWDGRLQEINGTPVKLVKPFSADRVSFGFEDMVAMRSFAAGGRRA